MGMHWVYWQKGGIDASIYLKRQRSRGQRIIVSRCMHLTRQEVFHKPRNELPCTDEARKELELRRRNGSESAKEAAAAQAEKEKKRIHWDQMPPYSAKHEHMALRYLHENHKFQKDWEIIIAWVLYPAHIKNKLGFKQTHIIAPIVKLEPLKLVGTPTSPWEFKKGKDITNMMRSKKHLPTMKASHSGCHRHFRCKW